MITNPWNYLFKKAGKTNSSSSWLINQKSVTNQQDMTEHVNNVFTFTSTNLQETFPSAIKDYAQI